MVDPSASFPPVAPPAQELVCDVYEADNSTLVGTITDAISASGSMPLNDAAEATISVPRGSASAAMLTAGRVVRVKIWGSTRQMFVIGPRTLIAVASDRDRGEMLTVSGVSLLAHEWRKVVIDTPFANGYPRIDSLAWNWAHPAFTPSGWTSPPTNIGPTYWEPPYVSPFGWVDPLSSRVQFTNKALFRYDLTLASSTYVYIVVTADDTFVLYWDGYEIGRAGDMTEGAYMNSYRWLVPADAGDHTIGIATTSVGGAAWMSCSVFYLSTPTTDPTTATFQFHTGEIPGYPGTSYPWKQFDNYTTTIPGMTAPDIIGHELGRVQARSQLTGWTVANGSVGWEQIPQFTLPAYATMWDLLVGLAQSEIDFFADRESRLLHIWKSGERGTAWTNPANPPTWLSGSSTADGRILSLTYRQGN